jgi:DtxR family Mn-dependent transcriptional regulator
MIQERAEEYLGAIYRLREDKTVPVPLSQLTGYFDFSPVSIHEMVKKLSKQNWVTYHPYHGVTLTEQGEEIAQALLRRHRLWERFLTDILDISWDDAHEIAGRLEHATPELVTERLSDFLGSPDSCPHGGPIPPNDRSIEDQCLASLPTDAKVRVTRISPESAKLLYQLQQSGVLPGCQFEVIAQRKTETVIVIGEQKIDIPNENAQAIWVETL